MNLQHVAALLDRDTKTVQRLILSGALPALRITRNGASPAPTSAPSCSRPHELTTMIRARPTESPYAAGLYLPAALRWI